MQHMQSQWQLHVQCERCFTHSGVLYKHTCAQHVHVLSQHTQAIAAAQLVLLDIGRPTVGRPMPRGLAQWYCMAHFSWVNKYAALLSAVETVAACHSISTGSTATATDKWTKPTNAVATGLSTS